MALVFSAITPHTPVLLSSIGKGEEKKIAATIKALTQLQQELYIAKPDIIIIITPHCGLYPDAFTINGNNVLTSDFSSFGDLDTKKSWKGSPEFVAEIVHEANKKDILIQVDSDNALEHGASVPLHFLTEHLSHTKIIPIGFSGLSAENHIEFGELLKEIIMNTTKRVAVISSGELSHTLSEEAPAGYHEDGAVFDETIIEMLQTKHTQGIINMNKGMIENADECGYRSILIMLGIIKNMHYSFHVYSYEHPFGVGYLTGQFEF